MCETVRFESDAATTNEVMDALLQDDVSEVAEGVVRAICGWWASPVGTGSVMARAAQGAEVDLEDLLEDVRRTASWEVWSTGATDAAELQLLITWCNRRLGN